MGRDRWEFTAPVMSFEPTGWDLYDMAGNVSEWVEDWYSDSYYAGSLPIDPRGPAEAPAGKRPGRITKGGSWKYPLFTLRPSYRLAARPGAHLEEVGFRCALNELPGKR